MEYQHLKLAYETFEEGQNISHALRKALGTSRNTPDIVEVAYDLQAGSYVRFVKDNVAKFSAYTAELADVLTRYVSEYDSTLDVGTGEMTTLSGVANRLSFRGAIYACDISWSRIHVGRGFAKCTLPPDKFERLSYCVADMFDLPFRDSSVDVIWTSHALEPNGGREREAIRELCRVARKKLVLFEPYYEAALPDAKKRMAAHGYIRNLCGAIESEGAVVEDIVRIESAINPHNPTHAFIVTPGKMDSSMQQAIEPWACPLSRSPAKRMLGFYFSADSRLAYPIIDGIPVLRKECAILATALA
jgi:uncharacterized protein YbaR (Trm112 family)